MLLKTHLAIGAFAALFFLPHVTHKAIFIPLVLLASALPDIDSAFSTVGRNRFFRVVQAITKHRGMFHSFTICLAVSILFAFNWPALALPFFLGYMTHLIADSVTVEGIRPFWPLVFTTQGVFRVGGASEDALFIGFCIIDLALLVRLFL